jgi:endonuclease/exonuclease/phosphatase family metal-dependent hydrolase
LVALHGSCPARLNALVRVLTWNLFHGRSLPPVRGALSEQFFATIAAWEWDVALLQEVPPWWPARLAGACGAQQRRALTSRNSLPALRRLLAEWRAELLRSNGGGSNAVLVRGRIAGHHTLRLRRWPERRVAQLVRLGDGTCVVNLHASTRRALAEDELARLWRGALEWAGPAPLILGGDLNLRAPHAPKERIVHLAGQNVDHLFARGFVRAGTAEVLDRHVTLAAGTVELSDHPPLRVELRPSA